MKLNVDGSMTEDLETAEEGGLARDENGIWQGGFVAKLMCISIDEAEAWALLHGLFCTGSKWPGIWALKG